MRHRPTKFTTVRCAVVAVAASAIVLAGCSDTTTTSRSAATTATTVAGAAASTTAADGPNTTAAGSGDVGLASSSLGKIVVDGEGRTLYAFVPDTATTSACSGGCAATWPPLTFTGKPGGGDGVGDDDLTTIRRDDGTTQVAFYGHPLYRYAPDSGPGSVAGQGLGGNWYVLNASGDLVKDAGAAGSTAAPTTTAPDSGGNGY